MPLRKLEQARRLAICSLIIELMRPSASGGEASPLDVVVTAAVAVSTFGPHPLSAAKIAETTGWPETNVRRSLKRLVAIGRVIKVGAHYEAAPEFRDSIGRFYDLKGKGKAVRRTVARLDQLVAQKIRAPIRRPFPVTLMSQNGTVDDTTKTGEGK